MTSRTPEQALQNRVWELETRVKDQAKIIYVLNKLVVDLQNLAKRHSCVLPRKDSD
jgi:uncharacterized coiled-coil protein SlyX